MKNDSTDAYARGLALHTVKKRPRAAVAQPRLEKNARQIETRLLAYLRTLNR